MNHLEYMNSIKLSLQFTCGCFHYNYITCTVVFDGVVFNLYLQLLPDSGSVSNYKYILK